MLMKAMSSALKKVTLSCIAAVLAIGTATALTGCGKSDEDVIRAGIASCFDVFKDTSSKEFFGIYDSAESVLKGTGIDAREFVTLWLDGYDYEITSVVVDGNNATADVVITVKQVGPVIAEATKVLTENSADLKTEQDAVAAFKTALEQKLAEAVPVPTKITIECTKTNGAWDISSDIEAALMPALYGEGFGTTPAMN
jgi:hypothetical protein